MADDGGSSGGSEVAIAYCTLKADLSRLPGDLSRMKDTILASVSAVAGQAKQVLGGAFAVVAGPAMGALSAPLGDLQGWVSGAIRAETSMARFNAVLAASGNNAGISAGQMKKIADQLSSVSTFSKGAAREAETMLMQFHNVKGDVFADALKQSANLAAMWGQDLPSAASKLGRALEHPEHAMRILRQEGVNLTEQQQQQIQKLIELGKVSEAQRVILGAVGQQYGGMAAAMANTTEGKLAILKRTWGELGGEIGKAILPAVTAFTDGAQSIVSKIKGPMADAFQSMGAFTKAGVSGFKDLFQGVDADVGNWVDTFSTGVRQIELTWDIVTTAIAMSLLEMGDGFKATFALVKAAAAGTWEAIVAGWNAAVDDIGGTLKSMADNQIAQFKALWAGVKALMKGENPMEAMDKSMREDLGGKPNKMADIGNKMGDAFVKGWNKVIKDANLGQDPAIAALGDDLDRMLKEFDQAKVKMQQDRKAKEDANKNGPDIAKADVKGKVELEMKNVGFADLHNQIRDSLKPDKTLEMQKQQVDKLEMLRAQGEKAFPIFKAIEDAVKKVNFGLA